MDIFERVDFHFITNKQVYGYIGAGAESPVNFILKKSYQTHSEFPFFRPHSKDILAATPSRTSSCAPSSVPLIHTFKPTPSPLFRQHHENQNGNNAGMSSSTARKYKDRFKRVNYELHTRGNRNQKNHKPPNAVWQ